MTAWHAFLGTANWLALTLLVALGLGALLPGGLVWGSAALGAAALVAGVVQVGRDGVPAGGRLAALGLTPGAPMARGTLAGLALGVGVAGVAVAAIALAGGLRWTIGGASPSAWLTGAVGTLAWLSVPAAAEEVLVRGYPLRTAAAAMGPGAAVWVTAGIFTALHLGNPGLGPAGLATLLAAGLFLGALVIRTGTLWWAVGAHLGWNWALAWLADVPVSGLEVADAPGVEATATGPAWLSGGTFGVEGSVVAALALAAGAAFVCCLRKGGQITPEGLGAVSPPADDEGRSPPAAPRNHERPNSMEDDR